MTADKARIWFFTDIHGSNACFRKFLNLVENENKPNVLIVGGDITGKIIVPLVHDNKGNFYAHVGGQQQTRPLSELPAIKKELSDLGCYTYECDEQSHKQIQFDRQTQDDVFARLARERLVEWVQLADQKLPSRDVCQVIINAGNDDPYFVDDILESSSKLIHPEGKIINLPAGLKLLSTGYSNITPWKCPRDVEEEELKNKIAAMTGRLEQGDLRKAIFNFHCPPKGTALDLADELDPVTLRPAVGLKGTPKIHVGSTAVREAIANWQPVVSLHGHIHQVHAKDKIGRTLCFNPGSDYRSGRLQGVFLQINSSGEVEADILTRERLPRKVEKEDSIIETMLHGIPTVGPVYTAHLIFKRFNEIKEEIRELERGQSRKADELNVRVKELEVELQSHKVEELNEKIKELESELEAYRRKGDGNQGNGNS
jgi:hypothetical protein